MFNWKLPKVPKWTLLIILLFATSVTVISCTTIPATEVAPPSENKVEAEPTVTLPPPTESAVPTETATPTEVPATELFPRVDDIENYKQNPLTEEDFESGKVDEWLKSLLPEILAGVDWENMKDDVPYTYVGEFLAFNVRNAPNWSSPGVVTPFLRDTNTFGYLTISNREYIFMPVLLLDKEKREGYFVKTIWPTQNSYGKFSQEAIDGRIELWKSQNITLIGTSANLPSIPGGYEPEIDPLVAKTFSAFPDLAAQFDQIIVGNPDLPMDHGDLSVLSGPGKIFITDMRPNNVHWYE